MEMALIRAQAFFETHAKRLVAREFEAAIPAYKLPLTLHFSNEDVILTSGAAMRRLMALHFDALDRHNAGSVTAHVVAVEAGTEGRHRISVIWRYVVDGKMRQSRVEYFVLGLTGKAPVIDMVDLAFELPERYTELAEDYSDRFAG